MIFNKKVCSFILMTTVVVNSSLPFISYGESLEEPIDIVADELDEEENDLDIEVNTEELNQEVVDLQEETVKLQSSNLTKNSEFAGGNGTEDSPYIIETEAHLDNVRNYPESHFKQGGNILLRSAIMNDGKGWNPIGNTEEPFTGHYDGDGYSINKLSINRDGEDNIGLFGVVGNDAFFDKINLNAVTIVGNNYTGGLIGKTLVGANVNVSDCKVQGNIVGKDYTGGLIGYHNAGTVKDSSVDIKLTGKYIIGGVIGFTSGNVHNTYSKGSVSSSSSDVGGLIGRLDSKTSKVERSYSSCSVFSSGTYSGGYTRSYAGGLIGYNKDGSIEDCYSTGHINGKDNTGGFIGLNSKGVINKCYSIGNVRGGYFIGGFAGSNSGNIMLSSAEGDVNGFYYTGGFIGDNSGVAIQSYSLGDVIGNARPYYRTEYTGGFIGRNYDNTGISISECYSAGTVKGDLQVGGFLGIRSNNDNSMIVDNYYDSETSGFKKSGISGITPKATSEMKNRSSFENWDFTYTWTIKEGTEYPTHLWNTEDASVAVTGIKLNSNLLILNVGESATKLIATISPSDAENKNFKWSSSNTAIAKVDSEGNVTAVGEGEAEITVRTEDGGKTAVCKVKVNKDSENDKPEEKPEDEPTETPDIKPEIGDNFSKIYNFSELVSDTVKFNEVLNDYTSSELKVIIPSVQLIDMKTTHTPNILTNFSFKTGNKVREIKLESGGVSRTAERIKSDVFNCDWAGLTRGSEVIVYLYDANKIELDKKVVRLREGIHENNYTNGNIQPGNYSLIDLISNSANFNDILSSYSMKSLTIGVPIRYITSIDVKHSVYTTEFTIQASQGVDRVTILTSKNQEVGAHSQGAGVYTADVSGLSIGETVNVRAYDSKGVLLYQKPAFVD